MKGMKVKSIYRAALMLGLTAFSATSLEGADVDPRTDDEARQVNVVNNFASSVRVFALDANGRLHALGIVARGQFKALEISNEIAEMGAIQIKVYPNQPGRSLMSNTQAIKTRQIHLQSEQTVTVWLEMDLSASTVEIRQG
jgi:hypothetical protein